MHCKIDFFLYGNLAYIVHVFSLYITNDYRLYKHHVVFYFIHVYFLYIAGGTYAEPGSPTCTHLVVDEHSVKSIPYECHPRLQVVKSEVRFLCYLYWFLEFFFKKSIELFSYFNGNLCVKYSLDDVKCVPNVHTSCI